MKNIFCVSGRLAVLSCGVGLLFCAQTLWPATGGRGGAVAAPGRNNGRGANAGPANNVNLVRGGLIQGGTGAIFVGNTLGVGRGQVLLGSPGFIGGGGLSLPGAAATPRNAPAPAANYNSSYYAALRRSAAHRWAPGAAPLATGFSAEMFAGNWPVGPYRNFFWSAPSIAEAYDNLHYFRGGVNNFFLSYPLRPYYLPADYFTRHPLVYFVNPGRFALAEAQARALRDQLRNGGIVLFDDHWSNRNRRSYAAEIRRIFPEYTLTELPVDRAFNPSFYALQIKPRPQVIGGVRQSGFTFVIQTPAQERITTDFGTLSGYFGNDGQVIILAN